MCSNVGSTNWFNIKLVLSLIIINCLVLCQGITKSELYPYGTQHGDQQTPRVDDGGSDKIQLKRTFKFFGKNYTLLYVNNNGIITFENKLEEYKPQRFPSKENRSIIAPFWADVNTEHVGGNVWFRETFEQDLLDKATAEIRQYFLRQRKFTATWMFIVTWEAVGYYGASREGTSKRNTFQAVLITNGVHSFVIFNYYKIVWTTGSNSGGDTITGLGGNPAQAGFNAGDQIHYYSIEGATTDAVINLTLTSNVNIPGKWVFQVDGDIDDNACENAKSIVISPSSGFMLGGSRVNISGPCASHQYTIKAGIIETNTSITCERLTGNTSSCYFPPVFQTGEVTVVYSPYDDNTTFSSLYVINNIMKKSNEIFRRSPKAWTIGATVNIYWNTSLLPSQSAAELEVLVYTKEQGIPSFQSIQSFNLSTNDTKHGEYRFVLTDNLSNHSTAVIRLSYNKASKSHINAPVIWSDFFPVRWSDPIKSFTWCDSWMNEESRKSNMSYSSSSCPCTLTQALRDVGRYHTDPLCNVKNSLQSNNCIYHSSAAHCIRRNFNIFTTSGEICCYDGAGELLDIRDSPSGGIHNRYHYQAQGDNIVPYFSHFNDDLLPFLHCCQYSMNNKMCQNFQKFRPPSTCHLYHPPTPAQAAGDPHITTLDGLDYTFNGLGDYILVEDLNSSAVIQVRAVQAKDLKGVSQNATVFSAVAVAVRNVSDTIEVYKSDSGNALILVNGVVFDMENPSTSELKDVTLSRNKTDDNVDEILIVSEVINLSVSLEVSTDLINILVMVGEESLKGNLHGLLGNFNGNTSDDLIARNGNVISSSSSLEVIHYNFGMTWKVKEKESLFSEETEASPSYEPVFNMNRSLRNGTDTICKDNNQCIFDFQVTGDEKIARSTLIFNEKFKQIQEDIEQVIRCPYLDTPVNGDKSVSGYSVGANATFWCTPPNVMLCHDCLFRVCLADGTWSGSSAVCAEEIDTGKEQEILPVAAGSAGGAGVVIIFIVVFCLLYKRRKDPKPDDEEGPTEIEFLPSVELTVSTSNSTVFENEAFLDTLRYLHIGGPYRIPRPNFVDPDLFDEFFF